MLLLFCSCWSASENMTLLTFTKLLVIVALCQLALPISCRANQIDNLKSWLTPGHPGTLLIRSHGTLRRLRKFMLDHRKDWWKQTRSPICPDNQTELILISKSDMSLSIRRPEAHCSIILWSLKILPPSLWGWVLMEVINTSIFSTCSPSYIYR